MVEIQQTHPNRQKLTDFGLGKLSPDEATAVERHLAECEACCETLLHLGDDTFVGLVRSSRNAVADSELDFSLDETPFDPTVVQPGVGQLLDAAASAPGRTEPASAARDSSGFPAALADHPRYRLVELLGKGGMGDVYKAEHKLMNRPVALKVINRKLVRNEHAVERFRREVQAAARLSHPNIVTAYDAEQAGDVHFLAMEYVDGIDLDALVKQRGPLPVAEACDYIRQAAEGLQHAHEHGMVHRDVKPHNLMVARSQESRDKSQEQEAKRQSDSRLSTLDSRPFVKILDFGLASFATEAAVEEAEIDDDSAEPTPVHLTTVGTLMGTPDFIAPEQSQDSHAADIRSDIYGLGCTLYYLLTGRPPFPEGSVVEKLKAHAESDAQPIGELRGDLPAGLDGVIGRMLAKDPAERFQTPAEVAAALKPYCEAPEPDVSKKPGFVRRRPLAVALAVIAPLLLVAAAVFYIQLGKTTLRIEVLDPSLSVKFLGDTVQIVDHYKSYVGDRTRSFDVAPGTEQKFKVLQNGTEVETDSLTLKKGQKIVLTISVVNGEIKVTPSDLNVQVERIPAGQIDILEGHSHWVWSVAASPDGGLLASASQDSTIKLWDAKTYEPLATLTEHGGPVFAVAFSPDGKLLASASGDATVKLWDINTRKVVKTFSEHRGPVRSVVFSPDGKLLASAGGDKTVRLWEVEKQKQLAELPGHEDMVYGLAFSPDGQMLASAGKDQSVRLWDVQQETELRILTGSASEVYCVAFSPDGETLASGDMSKSVRLWDVATGRALARLSGHSARVYGLEFTSDGRKLVSASWDHNIKLWDVESRKLLHTLRGHTEHIKCIAILPDGKRLASAAGDNTVRVWEMPESVRPGREAKASRVAQVGRLTGEWKITHMQDDGEDEDVSANHHVTISSDKITIFENGTVAVKFSYRLDPDRQPKWIDLVFGNATMLGIYKLDGDTLTICHNEGGGPQRPTAFESKHGSPNNVLMVLKRDAPSNADGSVYRAEQIQIHEVNVGAEGKLEIRFSSPPETLFYCPGAQARMTENGIELSFVRASIKEKPNVSYPAVYAQEGKKRFQVIVVGADGRSVFDRSGNRLWPRASTKVPAKNYALQFDGESTAVSLPIRYDGSHPITLECTVLLQESGNRGQVLMTDTHDAGFNLSLSARDEMRVVFALRSERQPQPIVRSREPFAFGEVVHVAAVYTGEEIRLFLDGKLQESVKVPAGFRYEPSSMRIAVGANPDGPNSFRGSPRGRIDEVRISNVARYDEDFTPAERFEPDEHTLVLYHFDEGVGTIARDSSGNRRDGEIFGAKWAPGTEARITEVRRFDKHTRRVQALTFTPDGKRLVSAGAGQIFVSNPTTGQLEHKFEVEQVNMRAWAMSPDGRRLVTGGDGSTLTLWDVVQGRQLEQFDLGITHAEFLAWSPTHDYLVVKCHDENRFEGHEYYLAVWDIDSKKFVRKFKDTSYVQSLEFSADGRWLLVGDQRGEPAIWDTEAWQIATRLKGHTAKCFSVAFSPDGRRVLTGAYDGTARLWNADTGELLQTLKQGGEVSAVAFLPDGRHAITGSQYEHGMTLWDLATGVVVARTPVVSVGIEGVAVSPDGRYFASAHTGLSMAKDADASKTVYVWRLPESVWPQVPKNAEAGRSQLFQAISRTDAGESALRRIASINEIPGSDVEFVGEFGSASLHPQPYWAHGARIRLTATRVMVDDYLGRLKGAVEATGRSHNVQLTTTAVEEGGGQLFGFAVGYLDGSVEGEIRGELEGPRPIEGSDESSWDILLTVKEWPGKSRPDVMTTYYPILQNAFHGHLFGSNGKLAVSPSGELLATCGDAVRIWNVEDGTQLNVFNLSNATTAALLKHDPRLIAIGTSDISLADDFPGKVLLWNHALNALVRELPVKAGEVHALALSPDGRQLAVGAQLKDAGQALLWNMDNYETQVLVNGEPVNHVAFTPDGKYVITATANERGTVRLFDAATGKQVSEHKDVLSVRQKISNLAVSPSSKALAVAGGNWREKTGVVYMLDLPGLTIASRISRDVKSDIRAVAFSPDCRLLALGSSDGQVFLLDTETTNDFARFTAYNTKTAGIGRIVSDLRFTTDGRSLFTVADHESAKLWRLPEQMWRNEPASQSKIQNSLGMTLRLIPAGEFDMGSTDQVLGQLQPRGDWFFSEWVNDRRRGEMPRHRVRITKPFYVAAHEVTVGQFRQFVEATGYTTVAEADPDGGVGYDEGEWEYGREFSWKAPGFPQEESHPVCNLAWQDAVAFCRWLSKKENATYRLPTEAEWEYACRAGTDTSFHTGDDPASLNGAANLADQSLAKAVNTVRWAVDWDDQFPFTAPVGKFAPNKFGLYDMHGNAWEWCSDWYDTDYYAASPKDDPQSPERGSVHVFRGGGFDNWPGFLRSADRYSSHSPWLRSEWAGFRVVREVAASTNEDRDD